ncbi:MAG: hypothetical protein HWD58_15800 [Bacteroidota bacterium]|nr:MAG: hypothetical protein HWD58_15800 [Bacteroidota bacterium]
MKQFLALLFFLAPCQLYAQGGMWTWMKGDSVVVNTVSPGNYGTLESEIRPMKFRGATIAPIGPILQAISGYLGADF